MLRRCWLPAVNRISRKSLNLQAAGIQTTNRGAIEVDSKLRTNIPNIWAIGDVHGGLQFTYLSLDDYRDYPGKSLVMVSGAWTIGKQWLIPYSSILRWPMSGWNETQAR